MAVVPGVTSVARTRRLRDKLLFSCFSRVVAASAMTQKTVSNWWFQASAKLLVRRPCYTFHDVGEKQGWIRRRASTFVLSAVISGSCRFIEPSKPRNFLRHCVQTYSVMFQWICRQTTVDDEIIWTKQLFSGDDTSRKLHNHTSPSSVILLSHGWTCTGSLPSIALIKKLIILSFMCVVNDCSLTAVYLNSANDLASLRTICSMSSNSWHFVCFSYVWGCRSFWQ